MIMPPLTEELIVASGEGITEAIALGIDETTIEDVEIRSVLTCGLVRSLFQVLWPRRPGSWFRWEKPLG